MFTSSQIDFQEFNWPDNGSPINPTKGLSDVLGNTNDLSISSAMGTFTHLSFEKELIQKSRESATIMKASGLHGQLQTLESTLAQLPNITRYAGLQLSLFIQQHIPGFRLEGVEMKFGLLNEAYYNDNKCYEAVIDCVGTSSEGGRGFKRTYNAIEIKTKWGQETQPRNKDFIQTAFQMWAMKTGLFKNKRCSAALVVAAIEKTDKPQKIKIGITRLQQGKEGELIDILKNYML